MNRPVCSRPRWVAARRHVTTMPDWSLASTVPRSAANTVDTSPDGGTDHHIQLWVRAAASCFVCPRLFAAAAGGLGRHRPTACVRSWQPPGWPVARARAAAPRPRKVPRLLNDTPRLPRVAAAAHEAVAGGAGGPRPPECTAATYHPHNQPERLPAARDRRAGVYTG